VEVRKIKNRIRQGIPDGTVPRSGRYPWPEKESQDDIIIKQQMKAIAKLVNSNLMSLADELWPYNMKNIRGTDEDDKIIPFPGKWHSD